MDDSFPGEDQAKIKVSGAQRGNGIVVSLERSKY